ncbi:hypothetical protein F383_13785 [Gossypium arboreum]|uniref:Uncharacterized protein n=1 Tax=Gossypium arboreum TaxID=29729 RepID=A0A0B0N8D7_GOSAR|nr:hypothetical protein F383_13785 [Gossypium arboreum]
MCSRVRPCLGRWHQYVITCKTMSGTSTSDLIHVRPYLGQWHRYVITCKTTSGTLALYDICDYLSFLFNSEWFNKK